jgi:hypothetical protein
MYTAFILVCLVLTPSGVEVQPKPPKMVELKGAQIPEHAVWRHVFHQLADAKKKNVEWAIDAIKLPPTEREIFLREASAQPQRDAKCQEVMERRVRPLLNSGKSMDEILAEQHKVQLECRSDVLAARDRVLTTLSNESQATLRAWINERREGITVTIAENEVAKFMQP